MAGRHQGSNGLLFRMHFFANGSLKTNEGNAHHRKCLIFLSATRCSRFSAEIKGEMGRGHAKVRHGLIIPGATPSQPSLCDTMDGEQKQKQKQKQNYGGAGNLQAPTRCAPILGSSPDANLEFYFLIKIALLLK
jgi:hypothetical protein